MTFIFLSVTLFGLLGFQTSCNRADETVMLALDTLDRKIAATEQLLSLDYSTIANRKELIDAHIRLVRTYYTEEMSPELGMMMAKYKGVGKLYGRFTNSYGDIFNEHKALQKQAADLRNSVRKGKVSRTDFGTYYRKELSDAEKNLSDARKICENIPSVEPDYQRISTRIQNELEHLAESNSDLAKALESLAAP